MKPRLFIPLLGAMLISGFLLMNSIKAKPTGKSKLFKKFTHGKILDFKKHKKKGIKCASCHMHKKKMRLKSCKKCHRATRGKMSLKNAFANKCNRCHKKKGIKF